MLPELHFSLDEAGLLKIDLISPPAWITGVQLALPDQVITHILREPENLLTKPPKENGAFCFAQYTSSSLVLHT
jgi:hypothetical protein